MNRAEADEIERDSARDKVATTAAAHAAAIAEAMEVGAITDDQAENAAIYLNEIGQADALADVLERMDREHERLMAPYRDLMDLHDKAIAALRGAE
jgi:hypothetical protein